MRILLILAVVLSACALRVPPGLTDPPQLLVVTAGGPSTSAMYIARTAAGIIVIDLGWCGAEQALENGLMRLGASTQDVIAVFLTHSHRDHIGAWRSVRHAPFYIGAGEIDLLFGRREHGGWIARWVDRLGDSDLPAPGDVMIVPIESDTSFVFGGDTLRAFLVPGHTAGSAAYLLRDHLFAGDAVSETWIGGFGPARPGYSEDTAEAVRSLESLRERLAPYDVDWMCTAHLKCSEVTSELWAELLER